MLDYKKIEVCNLPSRALYVGDIKVSEEGHTFFLSTSEEDVKVEVFFPYIVYSYMVTDEYFTSDLWIDDPDLYYPFYYREESAYIDMIKKEPFVLEKYAMYEVLIVGADRVINVIANHLPEIKIN